MATTAFFLRSGSSRAMRSKSARTSGDRRMACHAAWVSRRRTVVGPSRVIRPKRLLKVAGKVAGQHTQFLHLAPGAAPADIL